jgi:DNA-binding transcriptional MerR regulator
MMETTIPDKLYFKIGEVAKMVDVPTHVLRYWESEFSAIRPKRTNSKQRLYRRQDVELVLKIKTLLHVQGYTIAGAKKFLESGQEPKTVSAKEPSTTNKVSKKLEPIKQELQKLQELLGNKKEVQ